MSKIKIIAAVFFGVLLCRAAAAQGPFGPFVQLPDNNFIWYWGRAADDPEDRSRIKDFSMRGGEAGFRCELMGRFSPSNSMTEPEMRAFESSLAGSIYFIQEAAYTMNELDVDRQLDWAELNCQKPEATEADAAESQERVDRAREKAIEDMLKRRERREREAAGN